jgi:hypothetical protein
MKEARRTSSIAVVARAHLLHSRCTSAVLGCALALVAHPLTTPQELGAQETGSIAGYVTGEDGRPLISAHVAVVGERAATITDGRGHFSLRGMDAGRHVIEVSFLGYRTERFEVTVASPGAQQLDVALEVAALQLEGVRVGVPTGNGFSASMQGFEERRARGTGHFFSSREIAAMQPRLVTDVLRRVPGFAVEGSGGNFGTGQRAQTARSTGIAGARPCPVLYYLNGQPFPLPRDMGINHFVRPDEIAGIEVYSGTSRVPPQFASSISNSRCGVVVIWTHTGERR